MTKLRSDFIAHLQLRGFSACTVDNYIDCIARFAKFFNKSPLELTPENVRDYLLHLRNVRKFAVRTINLHMYSIKNFYEHFLPTTREHPESPLRWTCKSVRNLAAFHGEWNYTIEPQMHVKV